MDNKCTSLKGTEFCFQEACMVVIYRSKSKDQINVINLCKDCYNKEKECGLFEKGHKAIYYKNIK